MEYRQLETMVNEIYRLNEEEVKKLFDLAQIQVRTNRTELTKISREIEEAEGKDGDTTQLIGSWDDKCYYVGACQRAVALRDFIRAIYESAEGPEPKPVLPPDV